MRAVFHDDSHWSRLRVSVSGYLDVVQEIVRTKNRLKAVFRAEAVRTDDSGFYADKARVVELGNSSAKFVAERLFAQVEYLEEEKKKYEGLFLSNKKKVPPGQEPDDGPGNTPDKGEHHRGAGLSTGPFRQQAPLLGLLHAGEAYPEVGRTRLRQQEGFLAGGS